DGPGSAVHRSTSLRAAPRPGHAIASHALLTLFTFQTALLVPAARFRAWGLALPRDATPRSAFRFALENTPSMSEAGNGSSIASNCSQVKNAFCRRKGIGRMFLVWRGSRRTRQSPLPLQPGIDRRRLLP